MDIIDRLNDEEMYMDAIDDAIEEIEKLRKAMKKIFVLSQNVSTFTHSDEEKDIEWSNNADKAITEICGTVEDNVERKFLT